MGFTDNYTKKVSSNSSTTGASVQKNAGANAVTDTTKTFPIIFCDDGDDDDDVTERRAPLLPDQEILDSIEEVYFRIDADIGIYELNVSDGVNGLRDDSNALNILQNQVIGKKCVV